MGFDIHGKKPTLPVGKEFHNTVWWWHPLADYCLLVAPGIMSRIRLMHTNDGDGLPAWFAKHLGVILQNKVDTGHTERYQRNRQAQLDALQNESCEFCLGTGNRLDSVGKENGFDKRTNPRTGKMGWCNACDGRGWNRPDACQYGFSVDNVQQFAEFLKHSGGFTID